MSLILGSFGNFGSLTVFLYASFGIFESLVVSGEIVFLNNDFLIDLELELYSSNAFLRLLSLFYRLKTSFFCLGFLTSLYFNSDYSMTKCLSVIKSSGLSLILSELSWL